jgi:fatty-acyl-CoA synthase
MMAVAKLGADLVLLNTGFAGPQLDAVIATEAVHVLVHDDVFADVVVGCDVAQAWTTTDLLQSPSHRGLPLPPARVEGRWVILTSGTTGRPKGAERRGSGAIGSATALLAAIPLRARDTVVIAPPLFHAWGLAHLGMALSLSSTVVLAPAFDAAAMLGAVTAHEADGLVVVPTMLQRMLVVDDERGPTRRRHRLRYVATSGSDLGATLARRALARFGPVVHNVYGSTEVAIAAIATPADLAAAPSTVGRPAPGTVVRIVDELDRPVASGTTGRVLVGSESAFVGYTDGTTKRRPDGLMATGDLGRLDGEGRLFIVGREDDLVIVGGENVHPAEIEDCLLGHPGVADVAVIGVADDDLGQRLQAFVVRRPGRAPDADELRAHVRANLARFKVPAMVTFVERIPRTTTGKIRRMDLTAR